MKKLNWLMMLMTAFTLSFAACTDEPTPEPGPGPEEPKAELKFEASVSETTRTSAFISVIPSDLEADYMSVVYPASAVEQCATDAELVVKIYAEFAAYAEANGKTFVEYMAEVVKRGAQENHEVKGLAQNTAYYLLVFGVDAAAEYAATTEVTAVKFKTQDVQQSACTFTLKSEVYLTTAAIKVTPSDNNQAWHLVNVPVELMQTYTKEDGEYGWSQKEFFQYYLNTEIEALEAEGLTEDEIMDKLIFKGYRTLNAAGLEAKTKYVSLVAGVHYDAEGVAVTTELKELRYNSGEAAQSDLTFDVQVTNIDHYSADIKITPSDPEAEDNSVLLSVASTDMSYGDSAGSVSTATCGQGNQKASFRLISGDFLESGNRHKSSGRRSWFISLNSHCLLLLMQDSRRIELPCYQQ